MTRPLIALTSSLVAVAAMFATPASGASNICPAHKRSWAPSIGWITWRGGVDPAQVYPSYLRGWIWGENVGWVHLGSGDGPYDNVDGDSFGVNVDAQTGECSGVAWAENVGWINFGTSGWLGAEGARFDHDEGRFRGWAWGENVGWINLEGALRFVAALIGDLDGDGVVNFADLNAVLSEFNAASPDLSKDVNGDGLVNFADLNVVLASINTSCSS